MRSFHGGLIRWLTLAITMTLVSSCIFTKNKSRAELGSEGYRETTAEGGLVTTTVSSLQVESLVYRPRVYPFERFFRGVLRRDLIGALHKINVKYSPSNTDSELLKSLIKHDFVPVFLVATNKGKEPLDTKKMNLSLETGYGFLKPIPPEDLQDTLREFNWKGPAANVYNTAAIVVVTTAVFLVIPCMRSVDIPPPK